MNRWIFGAIFFIIAFLVAYYGMIWVRGFLDKMQKEKEKEKEEKRNVTKTKQFN